MKCMLLTFFLALALAAAQPARKIPPEKAEIQFRTPAGVVTFKHQAHVQKYGVSCEQCHHTLEAKSEETPRACSSCHLKTGSPQMPSLQSAVHKKCWDCHKGERAKGKKVPVQTECNGCHVKKTG